MVLYKGWRAYAIAEDSHYDQEDAVKTSRKGVQPLTPVKQKVGNLIRYKRVKKDEQYQNLPYPDYIGVPFVSGKDEYPYPEEADAMFPVTEQSPNTPRMQDCLLMSGSLLNRL